MRVVTREVFYCEFCKRHRIKRQAIERHEPRCIYNPERSACGWHKTGTQPPSALIARFLEDLDLDWLREEVEGCPACMLAVVAQARKMSSLWPEYEFHAFNYSGEVERFRQNERENNVVAY